MFGLFALSVLQSILLASGQVLLKFGLANMKPFGWNLVFWRSVFLNWQFAASGVSFGLASILWMYIIKKYPLSMAYPLISLSYVFGLIAAILFFHESVGMIKWLGVFLIMCGCYLIAK
ncbi:EamA family transporter [Bacteroides caecigallinarum]|uniref:EamA family transporter n=1 Tax=Bacteroides caecigallinarum TaxID=1411144 RepID=UPI001F4141BA|nr:EamA family transporter [Bacteroides caecigallinarum]MCF2738815.1 EamA family transporter [Bacteroides caecigallinarum]